MEGPEILADGFALADEVGVINWVLTPDDVRELVTCDDTEHALQVSGELCRADEDRSARRLDDLRRNVICVGLGLSIYSLEHAATTRSEREAFTYAWEVITGVKSVSQAVADYRVWHNEFYKIEE